MGGGEGSIHEQRQPIGNIKKWTEVSLEENLRMADDGTDVGD